MIVLGLLIGDVVIFLISLGLALFLRYGNFWIELFDEHILSFSLILVIWFLVFYISGIYEKKKLKNSVDFLKTFFLAMILNVFLAITFFYLFPLASITPKTNLALFSIIFILCELIWRWYFNKFLISLLPPTRILLISNSNSSRNLYKFLSHHRQFGYEVIFFWENNIPQDIKTTSDWLSFIKTNKIDLIVVPFHFKKDDVFSKIFYELLASGVNIYDLPSFYEIIFKKIPLADINEEWFLDKILNQEKFYDKLKKALEFVFALFLFIILLPLEILIAFLIKITSSGSVIYKQIRVGKNNKEFILYKFRTMYKDAEKYGPQWKVSGAHDPRFTFIGKILAKTHLDELPQLINVLKDEISFVGPRPERPEFTKILEEKIPYYNIRHIIKPGITGWAQINYKYGASIEDSYEKLQYDIYYIKNRSIILDIAIIIKTLKNFFINNK